MEARYEAITTKMSFQLQDLEHQLQKTNGSLNRAKEELARLQHKFLLKEDDWRQLYYDENGRSSINSKKPSGMNRISRLVSSAVR